MLIAYIIILGVLGIKLFGDTQTPWIVIIPCVVLVWFIGLLSSGRLKIKFDKEVIED